MSASCAVDDCERLAKGSRPWCAMHIERWRRWGDPTETHPRLRAACQIEGCDRLHEARGWCALHYRRWREQGDANYRPTYAKPRMPELDRLLRRLDRSGGPDACWPWMGHRGPRGYGTTFIERNGRKVSIGAHRAVFLAVNGDLPDGAFVLHSCHNPPCCNPHHLRAGSHLENMADRQNEGAGYARGNEHPNAVQLDDETIEAIRRDYSPRAKGRGQHALAARYGLSRTTIQRIVTASDRWKECG